MSRKLRYLSLCSGVEAASLAWEQFGFEPVAFCEIEPYAAAVLANRWPSVPNLGDMTAYPWERFTKEFGQVDICVGGPPCFPAGTIVRCEDSLKPIEDVSVGDMVLTHNLRYRRVLRTGHCESGLVTLTSDSGRTLTCTPDHPIYVGGDEFTKASDMLGRKWLFVEHGWETVIQIESVDGQPVTVYNLEVEDDNSYTADGIAVHNCQAFSIAGLRQGLHDPRGNLTLEYMRVIDEVKPEFLVYENVPGIISDKTHAFDKLLEGLQELGYALDLDILDAQEFGVAQRRRRVFVLGWRADRIVERHDDLSRLFMSQAIGNALTIALNNVIQNQSDISTRVRLAQMGCDSEQTLTWWLDEISPKWRDAEEALRDRVGLPEVVPAAWGALVGDVSDERDAVVSLGALSVILSVATRDMGTWPDIWQNEGINAKRALGVFADYARRKTEQPSLFDGFDDTLHILGLEAAGEADALGDLGMGRRQEVPAEPTCLRGDTQEGAEKGQGPSADASGGVGGSDPRRAVAFTQNQRDEVRLIGGDGQIAGTLSASQSGTHKQETLLCMASGQANAEIERGGVSPTLTVLHEVPIVVRQQATSSTIFSTVDKDSDVVGGGVLKAR